jgi:hypothetical protein
MANHLKLHSFTGTSDHDLTGLVVGQLLYNSGGTSGVQSSGVFTNGSGGLSASTLSGGTILSGSTNLYSIFSPLGGGGFVPYTGATSALNMGANNISLSGFTDYVGLAANPTAPPAGVSRIHSFTTNGITNIQVDNELTTNLIITRDSAFNVRNTSATILVKGTVVKTTGATGNVPNVVSAQSNSVLTSPAIGIVVDDIASNGYGRAMSHGIFTQYDTSAFAEGDALYLSPTLAGGLTNVRPTYPNVVQKIGTVLVSGIGNGSIQIMVAPALLGVETGTINTFTAPGLSASTLSGGTILSGSTNLYSIFTRLGTVVQNVGGVGNILTGGTLTNPTISITGSPSFASITSSGSSNFSAGLSASTLSGGTILSGSTNLYSIFTRLNTVVQNVGGVGNILTGGTTTNPTISITGSPSFNIIKASGSSVFNGGLSASTLSGGTILSGSTNIGGLFVNGVTAGSNTTIGGSSTFPSVSVVDSPSFNNLSVSGTSTHNGLSASTLSGGTILSGSTNLYSIFAPFGSGVQSVGANGNLSTGGTPTNPTISITASPSFNNITFSGTATGNALSATTLSGGTILSASTNLESIFVQGSGTNGTVPLWNGPKFLGDSIITQAGTGVTVNGSIYIYGNVDVLGTASTFNTQTVQTTDNNITMNLSGSHVSSLGGGITIISGTPSGVASTWTIDANGAWSSNTQILTSAITVNGGAIISGATNLYQIFAPFGSGVQSVGGVGNIFTGGTATNPTISITGSPSLASITSSGSSNFSAGLSASTLSGGTILSGSTNLYSIFTRLNTVVQNVGGVGNIFTGGTTTNPTISITGSPSFNIIKASGSSVFNGGLSASTLSGGTILSGSTNLYSIFAPFGSGVQSVGASGNLSTGGTPTNPTISIIDSPSFNNITFSGTATGNALSATTLSGGTILSGSTNLYSIFTKISANTFATTTILANTGTTVTHNLNTNYIICAFWNSSGDPIIPQYKRTSVNAISVSAATTGTYDIVIQS